MLFSIACSDTAGPDLTSSFVAGYVEGDNAPLEHVKVHLLEYRRVANGMGGVTTYESWRKTFCTTATGYFSFEFDASIDATYKVGVYTPSSSLEYQISSGNTKYLTMAVPASQTPYLCD
jgi:hypothetical protein